MRRSGEGEREEKKNEEHTHKCTHTFKRRRRMKNKRGNALKPLKTHIQPLEEEMNVQIFHASLSRQVCIVERKLRASRQALE